MSPQGIYQVNLVSAPTIHKVKKASTPKKKRIPPNPKPVVKKEPNKPKPKVIQSPKTKTLPEPRKMEKKPAPPLAPEPEVIQEAVVEKEPSPVDLPSVVEEAQSTEEAAIPSPETPAVSVGVDVTSFKFPFYLKLIQGKIGSEWSPPLCGKNL